MRKPFFFALTMLAAVEACAAGLPPSPAAIDASSYTAATYHPGRVQHIVLFKYKDSVTPQQRQEVIHRFLALKTLCRRDGKPYIESIVTGRQNSAEGAARGLEQGFIVTFASEGDRNYYVGTPVVTDARYFDPAHAEFKRFVGPLLAADGGALVFDFNEEQRE
jgi:hypothetical protein